MFLVLSYEQESIRQLITAVLTCWSPRVTTTARATMALAHPTATVITTPIAMAPTTTQTHREAHTTTMDKVLPHTLLHLVGIAAAAVTVLAAVARENRGYP